jgi:hypothetical protein
MTERSLFVKEYYGGDVSKAKYVVALLDRQIRMVRKGLCMNACMHKYRHNELNTKFVDGKIYSDSDMPHDIFRLKLDKKYPAPYDTLYSDKMLFSYRETVDFINEQNELGKLGLPHYTIDGAYDGWMEDVRKFWLDNPNGMISFG